MGSAEGRQAEQETEWLLRDSAQVRVVDQGTGNDSLARWCSALQGRDQDPRDERAGAATRRIYRAAARLWLEDVEADLARKRADRDQDEDACLPWFIPAEALTIWRPSRNIGSASAEHVLTRVATELLCAAWARPASGRLHGFWERLWSGTLNPALAWGLGRTHAVSAGRVTPEAVHRAAAAFTGANPPFTGTLAAAWLLRAASDVTRKEAK